MSVLAEGWQPAAAEREYELIMLRTVAALVGKQEVGV